jgi:drug/metabolite transporter (DMT)-like permease
LSRKPLRNGCVVKIKGFLLTAPFNSISFQRLWVLNVHNSSIENDTKCRINDCFCGNRQSFLQPLGQNHATLRPLMQPKINFVSWLLFGALCLIWGSSFILMKEGLTVLNAYQVAALRILSAGLVLVPFAIRDWQKMPRNKLGIMALSGLLGSFFPAFLFCIAETKIDSSLAGALNALTPLFVIILGSLLFGNKIGNAKLWGVLVGFAGCVLLFFSYGQKQFGNLSFGLFVLLATVFYGINVNMVQKQLMQVPSMQIASIAFVSLIPFSLGILVASGYFAAPIGSLPFLKATGASLLLGVLGTAFASVLFYMLVKRAGGVFASLVTYGIPFVAIGWGLVYDEPFGWQQAVCLLVILAGVYIANKTMEKRQV